ncbi:bifunctional diaminohydroxyphosphoribosylaminopyrimidine deaminase/5-amino-6-(5-phosphoribosylamino)uracil reductase RibD [Thioalkalivibrio thiocyanodenitrificans]|uniref:bifunctional diaminohydroxyphosphoribosylaminopyrimidine deaminase/5-amino-6-(5-phosphoribosylamino)uracil reductase RibD n=1 Tax=Thioalkalivibrio thiocyanodenitrificans TaxID=243063 RepID=UPI000687180F
MARALQLAHRGLYTTDPNPRVGCVIVRDGRVAGEGFHVRAGEPHAEILALRSAGDAVRGATVYVTLEPCAHHGRTPPCADALIAAGVGRVVAAMTDPNPRVAGQGLARVAGAGIETSAGLLEREARALNPGFVSRMERGRPFVRIKLAMSLDGRTAMASGESRWITGEAARHDVQRWRARAGAVLTGIGTVRADDPGLDVRVPAQALGIGGEVRQPLRVVLDSRLECPPDARLFSAGGPVLVLTGETDAARYLPLQARGAEVLPVTLAGRGVDLSGVMTLLARREVNELHVEAGPRLCGALMEAGLVDELVIYMAPHLMGSTARSLVELGVETMDERIALEIGDIRAVGEDWRITARPMRTS